MRIPSLISFFCVVALAGLAAQQPQLPTAGSTVIGTAYDSVRLRPMIGAVIRVDSTNVQTTADSLGRFKLTGIPSGTHALWIDSPILDTLGVTLHFPPDVFVDGSAKLKILAIPSQETIVASLCSPAWRARGPASLMGRVRDADSGTAAVGAKVSLVWYEIDLNGKLQKVPRVREAIVGADGTYRICGLPSQLDGKVQVMRGSQTGGDVPVSFGQDVLALRSMTIAAPTVASGDSTKGVRGNARLTGRVVTNVGRPIAGARVQLDGTDRATLTRANGEFFMDSLPAGTQTVSVRLLGFTPNQAAVDLSSSAPASVTILLQDYVPTLATVRVTAQRERALDAIGFARRKRTGMGWYLDTDQITQQNAIRFSDVVRTAPGLHVSQYMGHNVIQSSNNSCINIWVDGTEFQQMTPGDIDDYLQPTELGAVEVYSSTATPAEFQGHSGSCTSVIAWTKQRLDRVH